MKNSENLELVKADLTTDGAFDAIIKDVEYVLHIASPFIMEVKDPQKDLVDPAVKGTLAVLNACEKSGTVKKVVITSSIAAITDSPNPKVTYTELDWNKDSSLTRNPYYYSKRMAEETAWNFMKEKSPKFTLATINVGILYF
jgi:dihydroflavonol-4-reductase